MPCPHSIRLHHGPYREQPAGVEDHRVEAGTQRHERGRHPPVERRRVPVEVPDLDALMDQVVVVGPGVRSEEHTSELQSLTNLVCRLLLEKKNTARWTCGGRAASRW